MSSPASGRALASVPVLRNPVGHGWSKSKGGPVGRILPQHLRVQHPSGVHKSQTLHVWHICIHLGWLTRGQYRHIVGIYSSPMACLGLFLLPFEALQIEERRPSDRLGEIMRPIRSAVVLRHGVLLPQEAGRSPPRDRLCGRPTWMRGW